MALVAENRARVTAGDAGKETTVRIEIRTRKIVLGTGELGREVVEIKALAYTRLPKEYLEGDPKIWRDCTSLFTGPGQPNYRDGETVTEAVFQERLVYIRAAGERLARIRREHREKAVTWNGEETFVI